MDLMSNDAAVLERNIKCRWARPQNPKGTLKGRLVGIYHGRGKRIDVDSGATGIPPGEAVDKE